MIALSHVEQKAWQFAEDRNGVRSITDGFGIFTELLARYLRRCDCDRSAANDELV
jgi:hypothetical protein